jgi:hypothetical protein
MKTNSFNNADERGSGLIVTIVMTTIALATLAGALAWSVSNTRLNERSNQYTRSVAAAEAATEAVVARLARDFKLGGTKLVNDNRDAYRDIVVNSSSAATWSEWEFNDASGNAGRTFVEIGSFTNYVPLNSIFAGLKGYVCEVNIVSNARLNNSLQNVVGAVKQTIQLANIPIFQFAMYSSADMEISCGQPFRITGRVHSNKHLYIEPASDLTFESEVTAVGDIIWGRHPLDTRLAPAGSVTYEQGKESHVPALTLPIGTNNSPEAIREIILPPPSGEDPNSLMGRQRYFNQVDLIVTLAPAGISATTGVPFGRSVTIPTNQLALFLSTSTSFFDAREGKTVRPLDINVGALRTWSATNQVLFGSRNISSLYVLDTRTLGSTELAAVRVRNGLLLPSEGLTIATARPLYVLGHYNQKNSAHLGTANTASTAPASLVADAITVLSVAWSDASSATSSRSAQPTTVNAAFLMGAVDTFKDHYSGGMENFPRFLEAWGASNPFTYNGSMVKMFPSQYATNHWGRTDVWVYDPPARNWAYDPNYDDGTKLPPLTPALQKVIRGQWATVAPNRTSS